jgi:hypothetical protein
MRCGDVIARSSRLWSGRSPGPSSPAAACARSPKSIDSGRESRPLAAVLPRDRPTTCTAVDWSNTGDPRPTMSPGNWAPCRTEDAGIPLREPSAAPPASEPGCEAPIPTESTRSVGGQFGPAAAVERVRVGSAQGGWPPLLQAGTRPAATCVRRRHSAGWSRKLAAPPRAGQRRRGKPLDSKLIHPYSNEGAQRAESPRVPTSRKGVGLRISSRSMTATMCRFTTDQSPRATTLSIDPRARRAVRISRFAH